MADHASLATAHQASPAEGLKVFGGSGKLLYVAIVGRVQPGYSLWKALKVYFWNDLCQECYARMPQQLRGQVAYV